MKKRKKLGFIWMFLPLTHVLAANIVVDNIKNPNVTLDKAPNGKVDFININKPNESGVSHNIFKDYNVDKEGIILNNGNDFTTSQLGGLIYANPNFGKNGKQANLILNEVNGINKSKIEGFTEITGKKADYILANPNGIYINGAGFINVGRVSLTTGVPILTKFGELKGFNVENGQIVIGDLGVDVRNISMFDLISRTAELNGSIYGGDEVNIILGRNEYDYKEKKVNVKKEDKKNKPKVALDGKALGSVYAGRIYLQSTEKGVGVNSQGDMLADASDFEIDVNGDLVLRNTQAKKNMKITSHKLITKGKTTAQKELNIKSENIVNEGDIVSKEELILITDDIKNKKNIISGKIEINAKKIKNNGLVQGDITKVKSESIENSGTIYGDELNIDSNLKNSGDVLGKNSATISGDLDNNKNVKTEGQLEIKGKVKNNSTGYIYGGKVDIEKSVENNGILLGKNEIKINADLKNSKEIKTEGKLDVKGKASNENEGYIYADSIYIEKEMKNEGSLLGKNKITILGDLENSKNAKTEGQLEIKGKVKNNSTGYIYGGKVDIEKSVENNGILLGKNEIKINADLKNSKEIKTEGKLDVKGKASNKNEGYIYADSIYIEKEMRNEGSLLGKNKITILGDLKNSKNVKTEGQLEIKGKVESGKEGEIYGETVNIENDAKNEGKITGLKNLNIKGSLLNENIVAAGENLNIQGNEIKNNKVISAKKLNLTVGTMVNSGEITGENLEIDSKKIDNANLLYGKENLKITNNEKLENKKLIQGDKKLEINSKEIVNEGDIYSKGEISSKATILKNKGQIVSEKDGVYSIDKIVNENVIQGNKIQLKDLENKGKILSKTTFDANKVDNTGTLSAVADMSLTELINSNSGKVVSDGKINVNDALSNEGIVSAKESLKSKNVKNKGKILSSGDIKLENVNNNSGKIEGNNIEIFNKGVLDNSLGEIKACNNDSIINIKADSLQNTNGLLGSQGTLLIDIQKDIDLDKGKYIGNSNLNIKANALKSENDFENLGNINITLNNDFINDKKFISGGNIDIDAKNMSNKGSLGGNGGVLLKLKGILENLGEIVFGKGKNDIKSQQLNNRGFLISNDDISITTGNLENSGQIAGAKDVSIKSDKDIVNNENSLIFSGKDLKLSSKKNIENKKAEIYSNGNIELDGEKIENHLASIESCGNIKLKAQKIENIGELTGTYSKKTVSGNQSSIDITKLDLTKVDQDLQTALNNAHRRRKRWDGEKFLEEAEEGVSNLVSNLSYIKANGNIDMEAKDVLNKEGNITANQNINIKAETLTNEREFKEIVVNLLFRRNYKYKKRSHRRGHSKVHASTTATQRLYGDKSSNIVAGGNINIDAKKVGNGEYTQGKVVINSKENMTHGIVFNKNNDIKKDGVIKTEDYIKLPEGDKGLFKVNKDALSSEKIDTSLSKEDINGNVKENGETKIESSKNSKPKFTYLVETNVKFIDKSHYLGSDYFFDRIHFIPEKDARVLGDSFYETHIVNKAIFEATGKRYLNNAKNDKEQMQILYDNSVKAMEDMKLSVGVALTKDQINNLKNDIIWYVEEKINGVPVLVPKVYLSKETLASLDDVKGNHIEAGKELNINALTVSNTGSLIGEKDVTIVTGDLLNESLRNGAIASVVGENIGIVAKENIINKGGSILGEKDVNLTAENGNIVNETKVVVNKNNYKDTITDIVGIGKVSGNNVNLVSGKNITNKGGEIQAEKNVNLVAKENVNLGSVEKVTSKETGSWKNYEVHTTVENIGSKTKGENINIEAGKDINVVGSDVIAKNNIKIDAKENINVAASVDSELTEKHKSSQNLLGSKEKVEIDYHTNHISSNISGKNVSMESGKDTTILGSNIQADSEGKTEIKAGGNIVQGAVKDIDYRYEKTTKTGMFGLTGSSKSTEEYKEQAIVSNSVSGKGGTVYDSKNNLLLEGVTVVSTGNVILKGKDVEIKPTEEKSFTETKQSKKGFSGSIGGGSVSASYGKSKDEIKVTNTTNVATNITSGGKVTITAEGGKATLNSADVYSDKGIDISGTKGVDLTVSKDVTTVDEKHKSTSIGFDVGIKGEIKNTAENIKNPEKLVDFKGDKYNIANTASDLVGAIRDGADAVNDVTSDKYKKGSENSESSNLEGLSRDPNSYLSASAGINKNKSESHSYQESTLKGNLASKGDVNITSSEGSVKIEGTDITTEKDLNIKADKNIEVVSSKDKYNSSHSSSSSGVTADLNIAKNPSQIFAGVTVSENKGNGNTNGYTNVNSNFNVGGTHRAEASESVKYQGANVTANKVEIKGEKVEISSAKDSEKSKEESKSGSIKFNPSGSINKINLGYEKGNGENDWVSNQTSIVAQNGGTIESKDFINKGALIGSSNENEKLVVKADKVKVENLKDKEIFKNHGGGIKIDTSLTVPGATVVYDEKDKRQNTNSTAINTDFIVKGENKKAEDLGFNTDINKAQEITKDEEHHLDANLHTDLLNQEERDKITEAGEKLKNAAEAIVNPNEGGIFNTYKENRYGNLFNKYANEQKEYLEILGDKNVDAKEKRNVLNQMVQEFLTERGYEGPMPIIMIGNTTQSVDSRYDGVERIYISEKDLEKNNILSILGHELGHFNTYDNDEKTAENIEKRVEVEIKETTTNGKYKDLLGKLDEKYKDIPDQEEAIKEQESIPNEYKENMILIASYETLAATGMVVGGYPMNSKPGEQIWKSFVDIMEKEWEKTKEITQITFSVFLVQNLYLLNNNEFLIKNHIIADKPNEGTQKIPPITGDKIQAPTITDGDVKKEDRVNSYPTPSNNEETTGTPPITEDKTKTPTITGGHLEGTYEKNNIMYLTPEEVDEIYRGVSEKYREPENKGKNESPSKTLRKSLKEAGVKEPEYNNAAHHLTPVRGEKTKDARMVLDKVEIGINSAANGIFLPTKGADGTDLTEAVHIGRNSEEYEKYVNKKILNADREADRLKMSHNERRNHILKTLNEIRKELATGKLKINNAKL